MFDGILDVATPAVAGSNGSAYSIMPSIPSSIRNGWFHLVVLKQSVVDLEYYAARDATKPNTMPMDGTYQTVGF